ncbi:regulator of sigma E protease [Thermodesulfitimonas autotrophica]|uniref:Zinc metalloprotease n=1 Tax=Thermodesulfitimonas autotrophica TaxID=1894989 RepID=A0A3N5C0K7_9THEO|nr:RIP metalloprotease RseP [Thermodesulfitimonas autotrophica]RPF49691.1 regulator of sigma E protease [Thermodesulfitimonas autotrophica]
MLTVIAGIVVFGILIFFHEAGHYLAARLVGIGVHEFSLGFGPRLWGFKKGRTAYNLRAIPYGGYVRLVGLDPRDEERDRPYSFARKPVLHRLIVMVAGPGMNFVLAVVALALVFFIQGVPVATTRVGEVLPGYPAAAAGIERGDRIVAIDGRTVHQWEEVLRAIGTEPHRAKVLTVERGGKTITVRVTPRIDESGKGKIGLSPVVVQKRLSLLSALRVGTEYTCRITVLIADFLGKMVVGRAPADVGGPVRVMVEIGKAAHFGVFPLIQLMAFLSINLGFFNLLPVPALDGARVAFLLWEGVTRRPVDPEKESIVHLVGFAFLILLMVLVTYRDFIQLSNGLD